MNCKLQYLFLLFLSIIYIGCTKDRNNVKEFNHDSEITIRLVADDPLLHNPVAIEEDTDGNLWVVEMPAYMRDIDGSGEDHSDGRIIILKDTDEDGIFDERKIFLDSLSATRAIALVYEGVLFTDGSALKWAKIKEDLPSNIVVVDSNYLIGGNIEHQSNGLLYNLDNWIYSANSNVRYRREMDGNWIKEPTTFRGQWGMSHDNQGRLIYNNNALPLAGDYALPNFISKNDYLNIKYGNVVVYTHNLSIFPLNSTSVNRGYAPNVLDSLGRVKKYTSACSPHAYYGNALPTHFYGNLFVCAPEGNLISAYNTIIDEFNLNASRKYEKVELLSSSDETFRPVALHTGLNGSLYIVDMRKGIIQHKAYMTNYLRDKILSKKLNEVNGKGRIYQLYDKNTLPSTFISPQNTEDFLPLLQDSNYQVRLLAQKTIVGRKATNLVNQLITYSRNKDAPQGQIHALWTLEGLKKLTVSTLLKVAESKPDETVLSQVIMLSSLFPDSISRFKEVYKDISSYNSKKIDYPLAHVSGYDNNLIDVWMILADRYNNDSLIAEALVSGIEGKEEGYLDILDNNNDDSLSINLLQTIANRKNNLIHGPLFFTKSIHDARTEGLLLYNKYCGACHGVDGKGQKMLAPTLLQSDIINGSSIEIAKIILMGKNNENSDFNLAMPAFKDDPSLSDKDIKDLIVFIKNAMTTQGATISTNQVDSLRSSIKQ